MAIQIITNVPEDQVKPMVRLMKACGATNVTTTEEDDGEFTITGFFPDIERHADLIERLEAA